MSIIVRGMEMPENCSCCGMETGAGFCSAMTDNFCGYTDDQKRPVWCPLAEIKTPHGDLIDRDAFFSGLSHEDIQFSFHVDGAFVDVTKINKILQNQPVVIEAEGEG